MFTADAEFAENSEKKVVAAKRGQEFLF